jgi:hypothetical protein
LQKQLLIEVRLDSGGIPADAPVQDVLLEPMAIEIPLAGDLLQEEMDDMELDPAWDPEQPHPDPDQDHPGVANPEEAGARYEALHLGEAALVLEALPRMAEEVGDVMDDEWSVFVDAVETVYHDITTFDGPEGISEDILRRTRTISVPASMKDRERRIEGKFDIVLTRRDMTLFDCLIDFSD